MLLFPTRRCLPRLVSRLSPVLIFAVAVVRSVDAQTTATEYAWSTYPTPETRLYFPTGIAVDTADNVYASLITDHYVTKVATTGTVSTLAGLPGVKGTTDGVGGDARFSEPQGLAIDGTGTLYVAEFGSSTVRKISPGGNTLTLAGVAGVRGKTDGPPGTNRFSSPRGVAVDRIGNVYVADSANYAIRLITLDNHVQTVSGGTFGARDSVGTSTQYMQPWGIVIDPAGNIFVTDAVANTVRKISAVTRIVTTIAGTAGTKGSADGAGAAARFYEPTGITIDAAGTLFLTDTQNHTIRRVSADGKVTTIGGRPDAPARADSGIGSAATFIAPYAITVTSNGTLYVADHQGIRRGEPVRAPSISTQPLGLTVREGSTASLAVVASGAPSPTYQWRLDGVPIEDAKSATLTLSAASAWQAGAYTVVVTNSLGTVTSSVAKVVVNSPPNFSVPPQPALIGADGTAKLSATASGVGPFSYQWLRNGVPVAGATSSTLVTTLFGSYAVTATNPFGASTSGTVRVEFPNRLINLSTSTNVGGAGGNTLIAGIVVAGPPGASKRLLIRAVGPGLADFGVPNVLAQPVVSLFDQNGALIARNSGWATNPLSVYNDIAETASAVGAFPLAPGSGDSALLVYVARGDYTVSVESKSAGTAGRSLVEIYEVAEDTARLTNLSTRSQIGPGSELTVGFITDGKVSPKVLVRAIGPGLEQFGVAGALQRPSLRIFRGSRVIATNAGWTNAANPTEVEQTAVAVGAFPLARTAVDSALLLTLTANESYTAEVSSADGKPGSALVEIYQVP